MVAERYVPRARGWGDLTLANRVLFAKTRILALKQASVKVALHFPNTALFYQMKPNGLKVPALSHFIHAR